MYAYRCFTWMWLLIHTVNPAGAGSVNPVNKRGPSDIWFVSITNCTYASVIHCHEQCISAYKTDFCLDAEFSIFTTDIKLPCSPIVLSWLNILHINFLAISFAVSVFILAIQRRQKVNPKQWTCCRCNRATSFNSPISYDYDLMDI